jgi:23S rRNA (cytosine1962-C5)-methyltransferase
VLEKVVLKPGKEKPLRNKHHWIFSGAVAHLPRSAEGGCLPVYSADEQFLGWGYFNRQAKIVGRMVSFDQTKPEEAIRNHLEAALKLRLSLFSEEKTEKTTACRLVNGEGDMLPGLIVDRYGDLLVLQLSTLGMEKLRPLIVEWLKERLAPSCIYEKSTMPSRKEERLGSEEGVLYGVLPSEVEIKENGLKFLVQAKEGQKTGFFLDQRSMRQWVRELARGRRVLNCFCYTGGFSVYAAAGGASQVDSVDISALAMGLAQKNMALNEFDGGQYRFFTADIFQFLRQQALDYELLILDPPAFAKKKQDIVSACRGYKEINRLALQKLPKGALLLTCSCSCHVDESLFQKVLFQAAVEAGRTVRILGRHRMAADHPINVCHPEGDYLKSLLLYVE